MPEMRRFVDHGTILRNIVTVLSFDKAVIWTDRKGVMSVTDTHHEARKDEYKVCTIPQSYEALMGFATLLLPELQLRDKVHILFECHCPEYKPGHYAWDHKDFYKRFPYIQKEHVERMKKIIEFREEHIT